MLFLAPLWPIGRPRASLLPSILMAATYDRRPSVVCCYTDWELVRRGIRVENQPRMPSGFLQNSIGSKCERRRSRLRNSAQLEWDVSSPCFECRTRAVTLRVTAHARLHFHHLVMFGHSVHHAVMVARTMMHHPSVAHHSAVVHHSTRSPFVLAALVGDGA